MLLENFRRDPLAQALPTPSGRIEIYSETTAGFGYGDCPGRPTWFEAEASSHPLAGLRLSDGLLPGVVQIATGAWYDPVDPGVAGSRDKHGNHNLVTADIGSSCLGMCLPSSTHERTNHETPQTAAGRRLDQPDACCRSGYPTFSAWVASGTFAKDHPEFLKSFAAVADKYSSSFLTDKAGWGADSDNTKQLATLLGGTAAGHAEALKNLALLSLDAQASPDWLGGGEQSGVAKILKDTAGFLKEQKKISAVLPSYAQYVTPAVVVALKQN